MAASSFPPEPPTPLPRSRTAQRLLVGTLAVLGLLLAGFFVRYAWQSWQGGVRAETVAVRVISDTRTDVQFQVTAGPEATVTCDVRATADNGIEVGTLTVTLEPTDVGRRDAVAEIPTRRRAITGEVVACQAMP